MYTLVEDWCIHVRLTLLLHQEIGDFRTLARYRDVCEQCENIVLVHGHVYL